MSDLESGISKFADLKTDGYDLESELIDHMIDIYTKVGIGLLKKHVVYEELLIKKENDWQQTCDKLMENLQLIKEESTSSDC